MFGRDIDKSIFFGESVSTLFIRLKERSLEFFWNLLVQQIKDLMNVKLFLVLFGIHSSE